MSTLITENLQDAGGSVPVATVRQGSAKAWVNFNGTGTVAIRDSQNVSSITDNGTGDYTVNATGAMANANYSTVSNQGRGTTGTVNLGATWPSTVENPTTTAIRGILFNSSFAVADGGYVSIANHGDLA